MPTYRWKNEETEEVVEVYCSIADRDSKPKEGPWVRVLDMPSYKRVTYLDGQREKSDQTFSNLKKASQLEILKADSVNKDERAGLKREIDRLTKVSHNN